MSKMIRLSEEEYQDLNKLRLKGESFTMVVRRLLACQAKAAGLLNYFNTTPDKDRR